jgi:acetyl-CoA C-acetyltransferase
MAESIRDKVAIIGMGCTQFAEMWDKDFEDLVVDAATEACEDAGVDLKDIEAAWVGVCMGAMTGSALSRPLQLQYKPVTRVENGCFTGTDTIRNAAYAVIAKNYDLVLAVGAEKLKDIGYGGLPTAAMDTFGTYHPLLNVPSTTPVGFYALAATRYFARYGLTPEEGKRTIGKISVKSHYCGARNPKAHLRRQVNLEQVVNSPMIAWPLGLFDCCGVTDGASAAIMCRVEDVKNFVHGQKGDYITIKGFGISIGPGWGRNKEDYDFTSWPETEYAAAQVYKEAGIKNPRTELDMVELHDCFSISELIAMESLGLCPHGEAKKDIDAGAFCSPDFREEIMKLCGSSQEEIAAIPKDVIPVNHSGGLKSFGHPIGASGGREASEVYNQIQGKAQLPERQLRNIKRGLVHNQAGVPGAFQCGVAIYGLPE